MCGRQCKRAALIAMLRAAADVLHGCCASTGRAALALRQRWTAKATANETFQSQAGSWHYGTPQPVGIPRLGQYRRSGTARLQHRVTHLL